ncbi:acetyl-CoA synthetase-like protein [Camillea tinctor]|nr:acetyl-CoA synthetase-like protein [Camillea tinctor]
MESTNNETYKSIVVQAMSKVLGVSSDEINCTADATTFVKLGGDSLSAILISSECQMRGIAIPAGVMLRISTLKEVITRASNLAHPLSLHRPISPIPPDPPSLPPFSKALGTTSTTIPTLVDASILYPETGNISSTCCKKDTMSAKNLLGHINTTEWTEPQLLLLRETSHNSRLNILTLYETYDGVWEVQDIYNAWMNTILAEPIFRDLLHDLRISPQQLLLPNIIQVKSEDEYQRESSNTVNATGPISKLEVIHLLQPSCLNHVSKSTTVIWRIHHAFIDGYSARILRDKVRQTLRGDTTITAGPSFKEIMCSLRLLREDKRESTINFWDRKREQFSSATGELRLSPQRTLEKIEVIPQKSITIQFPVEKMAAAQRRTGYTTTVYFAAAWALTLSKFMDVDQICFGMVLSGRDLPIPGAANVVGPLINILPLFVKVLARGDGTFAGAFLRRIHDDILELNEVQHSEVAEGFDRQFDSIMATQFEDDEGEELPRPIPVDRNSLDMQSGVPANLIIEQHSRIRLIYSTAQYTEDDMNNVRSVFQKSMDKLLQDNEGKRLISSIHDALLPQEMEETIKQWSNCSGSKTFDESKDDDLVTLFESVVASHPTDAAIVHGESGKVSYGDLDEAAAIIAHELSWVKPNEAVCIYADRSANWIAAIFGVLKAGGVYAPIDPSAPVSVQHANFVRSGARAVLIPTSTTTLEHFWSPREKQDNNIAPSLCRVIAVDDLLASVNSPKTHSGPITHYPRRRTARPGDLAYICFTSGSTGKPKGVQCTHKGLVAFQKDHVVRLAASRGIVIAQVMSPVFDGSIHEIFSALTHGATLRLASPADQDDPFSHLRDSDSAILTPSIAKVLDPNHYPRLRNVYLVGEAVPQSLCDTWARNRSLYNMYGPTEATCGATIKRLLPNEAVTIGQANPSSRVYILNRFRGFVPPGVVGELYIAGIQVSHGYINLPELNAEHFLDDPIVPEAGQKMYKTGDYAYWDSATGDICLLGRRDRQIKLNGFRLDLDDLEVRVANAIPGCGGAAVFRRDDHLVAAYQASSVSATDSLNVKTLIRDVLPPYAMPRSIIALDELPLTAAGKLDYKMLERKVSIDDGVASLETDHHQQPQKKNITMSATERFVVDAVRELMKLDPRTHVDRGSNLTALGSHSILQLQLASRISSRIRRKFTVRKVMDNPVISHLAAAIDDVAKQEKAINGNIVRTRSSSPGKNGTRVRVLGDNHVSPIELEWYSKYRRNLGTSSFNVSHVSELDASFDQHSALIKAWNIVLARHAILRCRFRQSATNSERVERSYATQPPRALHVESLDIRAAINKEFSLETEDPVRVLVSKHHMVVCVSHIICDYTTLSCLFEELSTAYLNIINGVEQSSLISPPKRQYRDTSCWNLDVDQATAEFWKSYLSGGNLMSMAPPYMKRARTSYGGKSLLFRLSKGTMSNFKTVSQSLGLTLHQISLAIVSLVLQADSKTKQDLLLGSPYLGRQEEDMRTIGLFLQPLPIRIRRRLHGDKNNNNQGEEAEASLAAFLHGVRESAQSALSHSMEWSSLLEILSSEDLRAAIPNHPLFDAMVTFHEQLSSIQAGIPGLRPLLSWADGAKFGIMFEFAAVGSAVTLRVEYDAALFAADEVWRFAARVDAGLRYMGQYVSSSVPLGELERRLSDVGRSSVNAGAKRPWSEDGTSGGIESLEFGTPLAALS